MVLQIFADALQFVHNRRAGSRQDVAAPDARQFENLRRADGAGGKNDFTARFRLDDLSFAHIAQSDGALAGEHDAFDLRARDHSQIGTIENRLQKTARRAPAAAGFLVHLKIGGAEIVAGIEIPHFRNADFGGGFENGVENLPAGARLLDAPFSARAMKSAGAGVMVLHAFEQGQHIVPAPAFEAELPPAIVVLRLSAQIKHGVDGGRPADDAPARIVQRAAVEPRLALRLVKPVGARIADREEIAGGNVKPDPVIAPARFEQQHAIARIGRQTVGEHAARGPRAGNDVIEFHGRPPKSLEGRSSQIVSPRSMRAVHAASERFDNVADALQMRIDAQSHLE